MFGFLKRKREQPNLRAMHISLTNSFKNIKKDISHLHAKKQDHEGRLDQIERLLHHLHGKIEVILSYSDSESRSSTSPEVISPNEATSTFDFGALDSLTVVQRNILEMLIYKDHKMIMTMMELQIIKNLQVIKIQQIIRMVKNLVVYCGYG